MVAITEIYISENERNRTIKLLLDFFEKKSVSQIEEGIYDFTEQYCNNYDRMLLAQAVYRDSVENILYNCRQNRLTIQKIRQLIKEDKYNPYNLAFLKPEELDRDNWIKIISRNMTSEDKLKNLPTITWKPCRICKNKKYFFHHLQTRSADEPMTIFYICKQCDKTYKFNN